MLKFSHSSHGSMNTLQEFIIIFGAIALYLGVPFKVSGACIIHCTSTTSLIQILSAFYLQRTSKPRSKAVALVFIWMNSMVSHIPNREASCEPPCYSQYTSVGATSVSDVVSTTAHERKHISTSKSLQSTKSKRLESQQSTSNSLQHRHKISLDILPYELQLMIYRNLLPHKERIEIVPSQFLVFYHNRYYITREPELTGGYTAILCTNGAIYGLASGIPCLQAVG